MKRILATLAVVIGGMFVVTTATADDPHPACAGVRIQGGEGATSFTVPAPPDGWQWVSVYSKSANNDHRAQSTAVGATFTSGEFNANGVEQAISHVDLCKVRIVTTTTTTTAPSTTTTLPPTTTTSSTTTSTTSTTTSTTLPDTTTTSSTLPDSTTTTEPDETTSTTTTVPDDSTTTSSTAPETTTTVPGETTTTEPGVTTTEPPPCVPVNEATRDDEGNICGHLVETR